MHTVLMYPKLKHLHMLIRYKGLRLCGRKLGVGLEGVGRGADDCDQNFLYEIL